VTRKAVSQYFQVEAVTMAEQPQADENLRALLREHWEHCRHLELERSALLGAYGVVTTGVLAFAAQQSFQSAMTPLLLGLLSFLSLIGLFHTTRWPYAFEVHRGRVNALARAIAGRTPGLPEGFNPTMDIPAMRVTPGFLPQGLQRRLDEGFRTRYWYTLVYVVVLIGIALACWTTTVCITSGQPAQLVGCARTPAWEFVRLEIGSMTQTGAAVSTAARMLVAGQVLASATFVGGLYLFGAWVVSMNRLRA
jgi:hypothetical protein